MHEIDGLRWNYFTASKNQGRISLYPGAGDYRWEDLCLYLRKVTWDNTTLLPDPAREKIMGFLSRIPENCGTTYVYPDDHNGLRMVCLYAYEDDDGSPVDHHALAMFTSLSGPMHEAFGMNGIQIVEVPDVANEVTETLGRIELRIALLHEEAGFPRQAPVLWPSELELLDLYNAVEENFNAVKTIALMPVFNDEVRHEACSLTYLIAGSLRNDLYAKARAEGVPLRGDPYLSWTSKTSRSKGW
jgi:hypothetical protein